ncbi:hypothetical protein W911_14305 [Hyphomicrobium nitrativorans NL23]|uniref:Uncharacterized protein n=1 Tax=Hyphomicrobium nitrativorans NL23 TaxID=1029756 RepID=V5SIH1_9HYPH|nr:hypothetical protein [Hyphomicrobium nitrativorans]AHB50318.1 hypothetical protein W911_14305 [Hyphomicrobium nitrativorans NL23]
MPLTESGRNAIASAIIADSFTSFDNANAHLGAGDSNTAFAASQTDLQASLNKLRRGMEAGYPQRMNNELSFQALFGTDDANWEWTEWGLFNADSAGVMLTRKVDALGTKTNAQSWLLTATLTVEIGS